MFGWSLPRGRRRGADPARDRRARRVQLRAAPSGRAPTAWSPSAGAIAVAAGPLDRRARSRPTCRGATCSPARSSSCGDPRCSPGAWPTRRPEAGARLDLVGTGLSALGPRADRVRRSCASGAWGFVQPKPGAPEWLGLSPVIWLILGGGVVLWLFLVWENRRLDARRRAARRPGDPARSRCCAAASPSFFFQYLLQAGLFFAVPLFLSVALGLSAIDTGRAAPAAVDHAAARRRRASRRSSRTPRRAASCSSASSRCSPGSSCWSPRSTPAPGRRSSPGRCCSPASASARSPRSSARSPSRRCPTSRAARSAACRTRSPTSARRSAPRSPARS